MRIKHIFPIWDSRGANQCKFPQISLLKKKSLSNRIENYFATQLVIYTFLALVPSTALLGGPIRTKIDDWRIQINLKGRAPNHLLFQPALSYRTGMADPALWLSRLTKLLRHTPFENRDKRSPTLRKTVYIWALPKLRFDPSYCANLSTLWHKFSAEIS